MPKAGLIHDYDLMANNEPSARGNTCVVCDASPARYQWSDYHGEGMCTRCGCAYQLRAGSDEQIAEGKYPYLNMRDEFVPIAREFWQAKGIFVHYGQSFMRSDGMDEMSEWVALNHPEFK